MAKELFKLVGTIAINATDATNKIDAVITAGADLEAKLKEIGTNAETSFGSKSGFNTAAVWMGNMLHELTNKALELGKSIWNAGFGMNVNMESWVASFKTYLGGDLEAAEALVERLKQFAIDTPLSLQEVMAQATQLLATGTEPDKLIEVLSMLGDVSRGDMTYFSRISTAYWQIMTTGRLLAQDANQLTQAGVPVWQLVADYFNAIERDGRSDWTKGLTKDLASQAALQKDPDLAISSDELYSALLFSTSETGMYFNAMNNAMDTTKGKLEKLHDAFEQFAASTTEPFVDVMGTETLEKLTGTFDRLTAWFNENPETMENIAQAMSDIVTINFDNLSNGLISVMNTLEQITLWYGDNKELFAAIFSLAGLAVMGAHPILGTGLITLGAGIAGVVGEERQEMMKEKGHEIFARYLEEQAQSEGNGTNDDPSGNDMTGFEKFVFDALGNLFPGLYVDPELLGPEPGGGTTYDSDIYGPPLPEGWDGNTGSSSIGTLLAALQALPARIEAAAQTGVENGMSGVTITGNVTTGNVMLNKDVLVGALTPQINLRLGWENMISGRG